MGQTVAKLFDRISQWGKREARIVMIGLDASGKTTILYNLKLGKVSQTTPTIGFNVETVNYKNVNFTVWDVGGQHKIRPLWRHYYQNTHGIIFVVDSNDRQRIRDNDGDSAQEELSRVLSDGELVGKPLLVLANKVDLAHAICPSNLAAELQLSQITNRDWFVQPTVATEGHGLYEGLDWLCARLKC